VPNANGVVGGALVNLEFRCDVCNSLCTSKKQLDDHISGSRHPQQVAAHAFHAYNNPTPAQSMGRIASVCRRALLSFPINGYKLCRSPYSSMQAMYIDMVTTQHTCSLTK